MEVLYDDEMADVMLNEEKKFIGVLVADLENGECDLLFSYDMTRVDGLLAADILKDAVFLIEAEYQKALVRMQQEDKERRNKND
tara:strand:+ start:76 stop:327 length:252 start_codon:yes stop_codon:yes gene_type:complete